MHRPSGQPLPAHPPHPGHGTQRGNGTVGLRGKSNQMQICLSIHRERHAFEAKVQPAIFVVKISQSS